jgi:hypothetical protein
VKGRYALADRLTRYSDRLHGERTDLDPVREAVIAGAGFGHISPTLAYRFIETIELP